MAELFKAGDSKEFNYTKGMQSIELLPGTYKLECYGAQGGDATGGYVGGKGGYATGVLKVTTQTTLYVCVGGKGACTNNSSIMSAGGYNGGGNGKYNSSPPQYVGAGGGATSITTTNRGILKNFANYKSEILLVAGGGGGANWWQGKQAANGGAGGGLTGSTGANAGHTPGTGGTQTAGGTGGANGSFGQGGFGQNIGVGSAGGGGGYFGGGASYDNAGGGGGSGYASNSLTSVSYSNGGRTGHGYARITCVSIELTFVGAVANFNYTGSIQSITLRPGKYKLEAWGAQGTAILDGIPGNGGYACGEIVVNQTETFYICVGGSSNGYNGGEGGVPGGGATHIATRTGLLKTLGSYKSDVILVAGGGGGAERVRGGAGGGLTGGSGTGGYDYIARNGAGGSQTAGGLYGYSTNYGNGKSGGFGYGGNGDCNGDGGPTGGGGWYGGGGVTYAGGAGGGSSYIGNIRLSNTSTQSGVRTGNGYVVITCLSIGNTVTCIKGNGVVSVEINLEGIIQEGEIVTLVLTELLPGYDFSHWSGDYESTEISITFIMPDKSVVITANTIPQSNIPYIVNHRLVNLDDTNIIKESIQYTGTTDTNVSPPVNTYNGFVSPEIETVNVNGDGSTVVDYYYQREKYVLTLLNGVSEKYEYLFEEIGNIQYIGMNDVAYMFEHWYSEQNVKIQNPFKKQTSFQMPSCDITILALGQSNRLNTNIYKNIFPEDIFNYEQIIELQESAPTTLQDITQEKHGFIVGNIISCVNGKYQKAIAENSEQGLPLGIVAAVHNENVFTLLSTGVFNWKQYNYEDTSVLYLSDTIPGTLVHYSQIKNNVYVPVAVYINNNQILLNLQDTTVGAPMAPYEQYSQNFDTYDKTELDEIIQHAISGVM